jgi:hypothetical protein
MIKPGKKIIGLIAALVMLAGLVNFAGTAFGQGGAALTNDQDKVKDSMETRQEKLKSEKMALEIRLNMMRPNDKKRQAAEDWTLKDPASDFDGKKLGEIIDAFGDLNRDNHVIEVDPATPSVKKPSEGSRYWASDETFDNYEKAAINAMNQVNLIFIGPAKPGSVPSGDLLTDFVPQLIRLMFRFAYVAILISFLAAAVMLIIVYDNDEMVTKAKTIMTWTVVAFGIITLAFAIVKAITNINFFGFI